jgi:hypothetical protein
MRQWCFVFALGCVSNQRDTPGATSDSPGKPNIKLATIGSTGEVISALSPEGYWRLDEITGDTVVDSSQTSNGTYVGAYYLDQAGALYGDPDTSVLFAPVPTGGLKRRMPRSQTPRASR